MAAIDIVSSNCGPLYPIKHKKRHLRKWVRGGFGIRPTRQDASFSDRMADTPRKAGYSAVIT